MSDLLGIETASCGSGFRGIPEGILTVGCRGDLNGDGLTDVLDVILIMRIAVHLDPFDDFADLNCDDSVDVLDVVLAMRIAVGLDPECPLCP